MTSTDTTYSAILLVIYLVLLIPAVYNIWKHGTRGLAFIGWGYFIFFCLLRIVGNAMLISNPTSTGAAIINSVGLSPLIIAASGIVHEARFYILSLENKTEARKIENIFILLFHMLLVAAIALLASGASHLSNPKDQADPTKLNKDWHMAGGGGLVLLLALTVLAVMAVISYLSKPAGGASSSSSTRLAKKLVAGVIVACPLLAVRVVGVVVYFFGKNMEMNPTTGTWGFRIGLYLVPEVLSAVSLLVGGLVSRDLSREKSSSVSDGYAGHMMKDQGSRI